MANALPFPNISNGDDADVTQVLANDQYLLDLINAGAININDLTVAQLTSIFNQMQAAGLFAGFQST